jgi:hypothetical protein
MPSRQELYSCTALNRPPTRQDWNKAMDPLLISLVSACTALVASVAGPLVTLTVARRQFNANVLSANRQKWIEALRDLLAELVSLLVAALVMRSKWKEKWDHGRGPTAADPEMLAKLERIVLVQWKIRLLINPTEPDHQELHRTIDLAFKRIQLEDSPDSETEGDIENITRLAQAILKREWQRVKQGV